MTRNILLIASTFPPDNMAGAARPYRFHRYLPEFGYQPYVITASPQISPHETILFVPVPESGTIQRGLEILRRLTIFPHDQNGHWTGAAVAGARDLLSKIPFDAILSTAPPVHTHRAAMQLKRYSRLPWIADFRDPLVFNPLRRPNPVSRVVDKYLERAIMERADVVIGVADRFVENWRRQYPHLTDKMRLLWNGYDPEEEFPQPEAAEKPYKVFAHIGNLYGGRDPSPVLAGLERLIHTGRIDRARLRVELTGIMDEQLLERFGKQWKQLIDSGFVLNRAESVPRRQALQATADADYLMLIDNNRENTSYGIPIKLFEYIQAGRPILALTPSNSPLERILSRSGMPHMIINTGSSDETVDTALQRFLALPTDRAVPNDWFLSEFNGRRQAGKLAGILDALIGAHAKSVANLYSVCLLDDNSRNS